MKKQIAFSHVAFPCTNFEKSVAFYKTFGQLEVKRTWKGGDVLWLSDRIRPFMFVLLLEKEVKHPLTRPAHIGLICESREQVDKLGALAKERGCLTQAPQQDAPDGSGGYYALLRDPDGHNVEISFGQEASYDPRFEPYTDLA